MFIIRITLEVTTYLYILSLTAPSALIGTVVYHRLRDRVL